MSRYTSERPLEHVILPTDFRAFINRVLEANTTGKRAVEQVDSFLLNNISQSMQQQSQQQCLSIVDGLLTERRDLNADYGWVLAADAGLVYQSMGGKSKNGAAWAGRWMKQVFHEYNRVEETLIDARLRLENLAKDTDSTVGPP